MNDTLLDWIAAALPGREASPSSALFLLRRYVTSGREELRDALEGALTSGLTLAAGARDPRDRCLWLTAFAEAAAVSDDERLVEMVQSALPGTIDDLERLARAAYEPGEGMLGASLADQLRSASAFLSAFELTARLPYSMLAEELLQVARRREWDDDRGMLHGGFAPNAVAAQLFSRLAALHRDPEYAANAVTAEHAPYAEDAGRILAAIEPIAHAHPESAAELGVALLDFFALSEHPN